MSFSVRWVESRAFHRPIVPCLALQISTRCETALIDAIALRHHIGRALGPVMADSGVLKVVHGGDLDVKWLQRDFGIYVVNLLDTGQVRG